MACLHPPPPLPPRPHPSLPAFPHLVSAGFLLELHYIQDHLARGEGEVCVQVSVCGHVRACVGAQVCACEMGGEGGGGGACTCMSEQMSANQARPGQGVQVAALSTFRAKPQTTCHKPSNVHSLQARVCKYVCCSLQFRNSSQQNRIL